MDGSILGYQNYKNEVGLFLSYLAEKKNVAAATQKQALNALIFLYKKVLNVDLGDGIAPTRSKRRINLPTVFTQEEVSSLLNENLLSTVKIGNFIQYVFPCAKQFCIL